LITFWNEIGPEVRNMARNVYIPVDVRTSTSTSAEWSSNRHLNPEFSVLYPLAPGMPGMSRPLGEASGAGALFHLSVRETTAYFIGGVSGTSAADFRIARSIATDAHGTVRAWHLRSPGTDGNQASIMNLDGTRSQANAGWLGIDRGIRPALWVLPE